MRLKRSLLCSYGKESKELCLPEGKSQCTVGTLKGIRSLSYTETLNKDPQNGRAVEELATFFGGPRFKSWPSVNRIVRNE